MRIKAIGYITLVGILCAVAVNSCGTRKDVEPTAIQAFQFLDVPLYVFADGITTGEVRTTVVSTDGQRLNGVSEPVQQTFRLQGDSRPFNLISESAADYRRDSGIFNSEIY